MKINVFQTDKEQTLQLIFGLDRNRSCTMYIHKRSTILFMQFSLVTDANCLLNIRYAIRLQCTSNHLIRMPVSTSLYICKSGRIHIRIQKLHNIFDQNEKRFGRMHHACASACGGFSGNGQPLST